MTFPLQSSIDFRGLSHALIVGISVSHDLCTGRGFFRYAVLRVFFPFFTLKVWRR